MEHGGLKRTRRRIKGGKKKKKRRGSGVSPVEKERERERVDTVLIRAPGLTGVTSVQAERSLFTFARTSVKMRRGQWRCS